VERTEVVSGHLLTPPSGGFDKALFRLVEIPTAFGAPLIRSLVEPASLTPAVFDVLLQMCGARGHSGGAGGGCGGDGGGD
jgi:hypothetical protein